jgi:RNA polymerase sigma factor (sigma-70 family)
MNAHHDSLNLPCSTDLPGGGLTLPDTPVVVEQPTDRPAADAVPCPIDTATLLDMARACGVRPHDCEDVVQDVWLYALPRLARVCAEPKAARVRGWFFLVVRHKTYDLFRRQRRRRALDLDALVGTHLEPHDPAQDLEARFEDAWRKEAVAWALVRLRRQVSEPAYHVARLCFGQGMTRREIAAAAALSRSHVRVHVHRLVQKLAALLKE